MPETFTSPFHIKHHNHRDCVEQALVKAETLCQTHSQRFTSIRRRVLELVWQKHQPVGAYEVLEGLQLENRTAPPTVYRALEFLQQMGLVHRISSLNAYVGCSQPGEPHDGHFLICESCKSLAELDVPEISGAIEKSALAAGFVPRQHTVEILGLCPGCRERVSS